MKSSILAGLIGLIFSVVFVSGCSDGSAEKQGKKIDNTVESVNTTASNKEPAQKTGEKSDQTVQQKTTPSN